MKPEPQSETQDFATRTTPAQTREIILQSRAGVVENAIYDATLDVWMAPQPAPDPSAQPETFAEQAAAQTGTPTHLALKIYPKNEQEQWEIEMMEDVSVQYIPFGMVQLTEDERAKVRAPKSHSSAVEISPYTVTYTDYEATDGGSTDPVTLQLPILYATWPASKPLPEQMEYSIEEELRLPRQTRAGTSVVGSIEAYDSFIWQRVPMGNLSVNWQTGTFTNPTVFSGSSSVDANGLVFINLPFDIFTSGNGYDLYVTFTYRDPQGKWKVTLPGSSTPVSASVYIPPKTGYGWEYLFPETEFAVKIHRAASYFFKEQNVFTTPTISGGGIRISANNNRHPNEPNLQGVFNYSINQDPWIEIYNTGLPSNNGSANPVVAGTVMHELGHFAHYGNIGYTNYQNTDRRIRESFAPYSGWYMGEEYYKSLGWVKSTPALDITMQAQQNWIEFFSAPYSPLFVDLTDNYSQGLISDSISGVPAPVVWTLTTQSRDWPQLRQKLQGYAGSFYTQMQINDTFFFYDHWFNLP